MCNGHTTFIITSFSDVYKHPCPSQHYMSTYLIYGLLSYYNWNAEH